MGTFTTQGIQTDVVIYPAGQAAPAIKRANGDIAMSSDRIIRAPLQFGSEKPTPFRYRLSVYEGEGVEGKIYKTLGTYSRNSTGGAETHARSVSDHRNNETIWIDPVGGDMKSWWVRAR